MEQKGAEEDRSSAMVEHWCSFLFRRRRSRSSFSLQFRLGGRQKEREAGRVWRCVHNERSVGAGVGIPFSAHAVACPTRAGAGSRFYFSRARLCIRGMLLEEGRKCKGRLERSSGISFHPKVFPQDATSSCGAPLRHEELFCACVFSDYRNSALFSSGGLKPTRRTGGSTSGNNR